MLHVWSRLWEGLALAARPRGEHGERDTLMRMSWSGRGDRTTDSLTQSTHSTSGCYSNAVFALKMSSLFFLCFLNVCLLGVHLRNATGKTRQCLKQTVMCMVDSVAQGFRV